MPPFYKAQMAIHLGINTTTSATYDGKGGKGGKADSASSTEPVAKAPVPGPKLDPKKLQDQLRGLQTTRANMVKNELNTDELDEKIASVKGLNYASKEDEAKVRYHEQRLAVFQGKVDTHPDRCLELQAVLEKAQHQAIKAQEELDKHKQQLQSWQERVQYHQTTIDELKCIIGGYEDTDKPTPAPKDEAAHAAEQALPTALAALATANPNVVGLAAALDLISNLLKGPQKKDDPMETDYPGPSQQSSTQGVSSDTAQSEIPPGQTLEQIEEQLAQTANANKLAAEKLEQRKAELDQNQKLLLEQQRRKEEQQRSGETESQDESQHSEDEATKAQAWKALQAENNKAAEIQALAAAQEARAAEAARLHEMGQRTEPPTQASTNTGEKHAHDGETEGGKDPKIARSTPAESTQHVAGHADATITDGEAKPNATAKGAGGKGSKGSRPDDMPY